MDKNNGQVIKESNDQYFTPPEFADLYAKEVVKVFGKNAMYLEPTAGSGVFVDALVKCGVPLENITAFDLDPKREDIIQKDVFELTGKVVIGKVVIGNLPYGKGGSFAIKIMNHLCEQGCENLCLLNPICVGHKDFTLKTLHSNLSLVKVLDFPKGQHFFYPNSPDKDLSKPNPVRCEFQFWKKQETPRKVSLCPKETLEFEVLPIGCKKIKKENSSGKSCSSELTLKERLVCDTPDKKDLINSIDFVITSHGKNAGRVILLDLDSQKANVNMFIKVKEGFNKKEVMERLGFVEGSPELSGVILEELQKYSTISHNPSIAPTELISYAVTSLGFTI